MDRSDRQPRDNPASEVTGRAVPPETLRDAHGSKQAGPGDRHAAKVTNDGPAPHPSVKADAQQESLDEGLEESFPGSDPVSSTRRS